MLSTSVSLISKLTREKYVLIPLILLMPILLAAILAEYIAPYDPFKSRIGPALSPPTDTFLFGTDQAGRDIFSQVVYGARTALYVALTSTAVAVLLGFAIGLIAGYFRGVVDEILMRMADVVLSIPSFVLIIFLIVLFGGSINTIALVIGFVSWPTLSRVVRSQVLTIREREFVLAARAVGASSFYIILSEVLPNVILPVLPAVTLQMSFAVLVEAGISFLGLGDQSTMSWGNILWLASRSIYVGVWWGILFPGLAISVTIMGFNLLGDGISKIINPRQIRKS